MMTKKHELQRRALLHRQASDLLREEAIRHDQVAKAIDGQRSDHERAEILLRLRWLEGLFRQGTLEYRLTRMQG